MTTKNKKRAATRPIRPKQSESADLRRDGSRDASVPSTPASVPERLDVETSDPDVVRRVELVRDLCDAALSEKGELAERARSALLAAELDFHGNAAPPNPKAWRQRTSSRALENAVIELERARAEAGHEPLDRTVARLARAINARCLRADRDGLGRVDAPAWERAIRAWPGVESIRPGRPKRPLGDTEQSPAADAARRLGAKPPPRAAVVLHQLLRPVGLTDARDAREFGKQIARLRKK